jgi:hypothetical protein
MSTTLKNVAIALLVTAATSFTMAFPAFAQLDPTRGRHEIEKPNIIRGLLPSRVFLFNDDVELESVTGTEITVASLTYRSSKRHRLVIDYSSVGALTPNDIANPAILFIGCFVNGIPCIGSQTNPPDTPEGWVNVLSCNFAGQFGQPTYPCAWDNNVSKIWFSRELPPGSHTVEINAATGAALFGFLGSGRLTNEARNLVVTLLRPGFDED